VPPVAHRFEPGAENRPTHACRVRCSSPVLQGKALDRSSTSSQTGSKSAISTRWTGSSSTPGPRVIRFSISAGPFALTLSRRREAIAGAARELFAPERAIVRRAHAPDLCRARYPPQGTAAPDRGVGPGSRAKLATRRGGQLADGPSLCKPVPEVVRPVRFGAAYPISGRDRRQ
jgi:hypothetical protein